MPTLTTCADGDSLLKLPRDTPQLTRALLPTLRSQPASAILNIGSVFGSLGYPGFTAYSATKFALRGFTEALRREMADSKIGVHYFAPRATKTGAVSSCPVALVLTTTSRRSHFAMKVSSPRV